MKNIIVTGATGLIGRNLSQKLFEAGYQVTVFSRNASSAKNALKKDFVYINWDYKNNDNWIETISSADAIVHLAGINLFAKRWNKIFKEEILASRKETTKALVDTIKLSQAKLKVFVSASAVGYYGDCGDKFLDENSPVGNDFLAEVCKVWEDEAAKVEQFGIRRVSIRTGIVLSKEDGALKRMLLPFKLFVGGPLGNGKQWFPWIHIDDIVGIYLHAIKNQNLSGAVNAASPNICTMEEFAKTLGKVLNRPSLFSVPEFALKIAIGEAGKVVLMSQRVKVDKLLRSGYEFKFEVLEEALKNCIS